MKVLDHLPNELAFRNVFGFFDDFAWYISPHMWTSLAADSGTTVAISASAAAGAVTIGTGTTDNNEAALATTNKNFKFADDKPIVFEASVQYAEANTSAANVFIGLSSALAADQLVDNGAGPATSFSGAGFYKVDGETSWRFVTSMGSTQTKSNLLNNTAGGSATAIFRIEVNMVTSTQAEVIPKINGVQCVDSVTLRPIKHVVTLSSPAAMAAGVYVKCGSTSAESITVDYVACYQKR